MDRRAIGVAALLFVAGTAFGIVHARIRPSPEERAIREAVLEAADAASRGDLEQIWDRIDPDSKSLFDGSHSGLLRFAAFYDAERGKDRILGRIADDMEREYRMPLKELVRSTPRTVWIRRIRTALEDGGVPSGFSALEIDEVKSDGTRAQVRCTLHQGVAQGFHLVKRDGRWNLLDFQPYRTLEQSVRLSGSGRKDNSSSGVVAAPAASTAASASGPVRAEVPPLSANPSAVSPTPAR